MERPKDASKDMERLHWRAYQDEWARSKWLKFDITEAPPTAAMLASRRESVQRTKSRTERLTPWVRFFSTAGLLVLLLVVVASLSAAYGYGPESLARRVLGTHPAVLYGYVMLLGLLSGVAYKAARTEISRYVHTMVAMCALVGVITLLEALTKSAWLALAVGAIAYFLLCVAWAALVAQRLLKEIPDIADAALYSLTALGEKGTRHAIEGFVRYAAHYETVRSYQNAVAAQGRLPVMGEFFAMWRWILDERPRTEPEPRENEWDRERRRLFEILKKPIIVGE